MLPCELPIFILSAPPVAGCVVNFVLEKQVASEAEWSVTLGGTGLTGSATFTAKATATFGVAAGEAKLIFVPLRIPTQIVTRRDAAGDLRTYIEPNIADVEIAGQAGRALCANFLDGRSAFRRTDSRWRRAPPARSPSSTSRPRRCRRPGYRSDLRRRVWRPP